MLSGLALIQLIGEGSSRLGTNNISYFECFPYLLQLLEVQQLLWRVPLSVLSDSRFRTAIHLYSSLVTQDFWRFFEIFERLPQMEKKTAILVKLVDKARVQTLHTLLFAFRGSGALEVDFVLNICRFGTLSELLAFSQSAGFKLVLRSEEGTISLKESTRPMT
jgi:hypothetical protein